MGKLSYDKVIRRCVAIWRYRNESRSLIIRHKFFYFYQSIDRESYLHEAILGTHTHFILIVWAKQEREREVGGGGRNKSEMLAPVLPHSVIKWLIYNISASRIAMNFNEMKKKIDKFTYSHIHRIVQCNTDIIAERTSENRRSAWVYEHCMKNEAI